MLYIHVNVQVSARDCPKRVRVMRIGIILAGASERSFELSEPGAIGALICGDRLSTELWVRLNGI
jgi:hypothetical protein